MRRFVMLFWVVAAALTQGSCANGQDTFVVKGLFDSSVGVVWRWVDIDGTVHDSAQSEGTAHEVDPERRLNGRLVLSVRNGDKVRFEIEGNADHGVIFENGKDETSATSPAWSRLSGADLSDLPTAPSFNHYDRAKANTTGRVDSEGLIIEIEVKDLKEDEPIFFACHVHSVNGNHGMFGALVLGTQKNEALVRRLAATSRLVSTGTSHTLSFDEALKDALSKLPPTPFPDGLRTFSVMEINGSVGTIAGLQDLHVTILAEDQAPHDPPMNHGGDDSPGTDNGHAAEGAHAPEE